MASSVSSQLSGVCWQMMDVTVSFKSIWAALASLSLAAVQVWWPQYLLTWNYSFFSKTHDLTIMELSVPFKEVLPYSCLLLVQVWYPNRRNLPVCSYSVTIILAKNFCVLPESHDLKMIMSWLSFKLVWIEYVTLSLPAVQICWHSSFVENEVMVFFQSHKI